MSARRRAQLLLPTPLGLVEYDVLEDAVFLGPGRRGGLTADPAPFPEATVAITWSTNAFVIRALPGEAAPVVNGAEGNGSALAGGDRISIGDHVAAWRADQPTSATTSAPTAPLGLDPDLVGPGDAGTTDPVRRGPTRPRASVRRLKPNPWVTAVALAGALLCLVGVYRALGHLGGLSADKRVQVYIPDPPAPPAHAVQKPDKATLAYREVAATVAASPADLDGALARYRDFHRRYPDSPEADLARARIREVFEGAAKEALARTDREIEELLAQGQFAVALERVRSFERRFAATASGEAAERLRQGVRKQARQALDVLLQKVGPLIATDPRLAHRMLLDAGSTFPPDLIAEITDLMERALELMKSQRQSRPGPRDPRRPAPPRQPDTPPGTPPDAPPDAPPGTPPPDGAAAKETAARTQWKAAYDDLEAGRYAESLDGFSLLSMRFANTRIYRENRAAIGAGRLAAKAGAQGPAALLSVPAEEKRGKLEIEYTFDDARVLLQDFSIEQPFPSDRPIKATPERGELKMSQSTGLFHVLVWDSDVTIEARVRAEIAHDFGILAVAETDEYRAVMLNVGNTLFTLKKGAAARANPGHLLWFMGEGVWADADSDAIGYIKIAERSKVTLEDGDRLTLEMIRNGDRVEGSFHGRTDGVSLKGQVKGDDGRGMGPARLGIFVNTGAIVVESVTIRGKVDQDWFRRYLAQLVDQAGGPEE